MLQGADVVPNEEDIKTLAGNRTYNRADRRRKPRRVRTVVIDYVHVPENQYTKATHKIKKMRKKNAPSKQQRQRTIANARKARKETYTQVS